MTKLAGGCPQAESLGDALIFLHAYIRLFTRILSGIEVLS